MVWGRPVEAKIKESAPGPLAPVIPVEPEAPAHAQPLTDLPAAPAAPAPASAALDLASTPVPIADAVAAAEPVSAPVAPPQPPMPTPSRRSRRAPQQHEPVAADLPPIAPVAPAETERTAPSFRAELPSAPAPAPMLEAVLAPAEPFELLAPVLEDVVLLEVVADAPAPTAPAAEPRAARPESSARRVRTVRVEPAPRPESTLRAEPAPQPESKLRAEPAPQPEPFASPRPAASGVDEFEAAARLFSFTGELPVQFDAQPRADGDKRARTQSAVREPRPNRGAAFRRVTAASFSVGVMGIVGLMTVGMTTPAAAVAAASGVGAPMSIVAPGETATTEIAADEIQAYVAPAGVEPDALDRTESYDTTTIAELASEAGIRNFSNLFVNDPNSAIQWPFAVGVTMSYGFGMRSGRMHEGIDFTPGAGAPIQAIAEGTVRVASEAGGAYGVHVIIDHMIDGQLVSSHYAHMQYGSLQVSAGQKVTVGTLLGRTGNTGRSYGAHTHFEILMNGTTAIDPMPWLREHAGG
ncbi:peptidoglycan DD-metalloendopeptidase family protein [Microbacterium sp. CFBP9034]|uniref:peptidoglycan DD-metalloendopeptidase family protein n=1 Tax=Microbacterium sp. CFBP9034 TaxID=3096540 RepID=UPI002A6B4127|nr:peptidoglycan DD-metalloendopeptidase family protein [Microbacterium sp. CFBP9034]MDY0908798.1 peptidoglycan DD-metalloendopeptidase family protein [Microbacterium sp. CFBP9034]